MTPQPKPEGPSPDDYEDYDDGMSEEERLEEEAELDCGEMPDGGCSLAGTEWCDWDCPFSAGMMKRVKIA